MTFEVSSSQCFCDFVDHLGCRRTPLKCFNPRFGVFIFKTVTHNNKNCFKMEYLLFGYFVDSITVCMIQSVVQVS